MNWYYYKLTSNNGHGDTYYCLAHNIKHAREICGLEPKCESRAIGGRISQHEYHAAKPGYGVHIY